MPALPKMPSMPKTLLNKKNVTESQKKTNIDLKMFEKLSPIKKKMLLEIFTATRKTFYNEAVMDECDRGCKNFIVFILACLGFVLFTFIGSTPHKIMVLR